MDSDIASRKTDDISVCTNPEHKIFLQSAPIPKAGPGQCLVHIRATGICGSDVHFWKNGGIGDMVIQGDIALGHESAGVVLDVGRGVSKFKPGDRVALECGIPCGKPTCSYCRTGQYNLCPGIMFFSTPPYDGTMRRYHLHPEAWLHRLPDEVSFEEGSLLEPFSVGLAGIDRSGLRLGDPLVICGAGPIGLVTLLAAHAAGANPIAIVDRVEHRLEFAKSLVPRVRTVLAGANATPKETAEQIKQVLGQAAKIALECSGAEQSLQTAVYCCKDGGLVHVIGCGAVFQSIPFAYMSAHEVELRFQFRYRDTYPKAIGLVSAGLIDLKPLVSHRFKLEEGEQAFMTVTDPVAKSIKVQILDD